MSPEYAMQGIFSIKSDVYSFGVLLLEIVSGRKNSIFTHQESSVSLLGYVSKAIANLCYLTCESIENIFSVITFAYT